MSRSSVDTSLKRRNTGQYYFSVNLKQLLKLQMLVEAQSLKVFFSSTALEIQQNCQNRASLQLKLTLPNKLLSTQVCDQEILTTDTVILENLVS